MFNHFLETGMSLKHLYGSVFAIMKYMHLFFRLAIFIAFIFKNYLLLFCCELMQNNMPTLKLNTETLTINFLKATISLYVSLYSKNADFCYKI